MPSNAARSSEEVRRRLLLDMGIEVWYGRGRAQDATPAREEEAARETGKAAGQSAGTGVAGPSDSGPPKTGSVPRMSGARRSAPTADPERRDDTAFAVVALGLPGALLVIDASPRRREAELARDVLCAARGDWSSAVGQARFEWPQPGVPGAPGPALTAFVEKQAEDFGACPVLVTESVAGRLGDCPLDLVRVPDLPSLAEPRNKVALWRRFQQRAP